MSSHQEKSRLTIECTLEEKAFIKKTLAAMKEAKEGKGTTYNSMNDFWKEMGVKPSTKSKIKSSI